MTMTRSLAAITMSMSCSNQEHGDAALGAQRADVLEQLRGQHRRDAGHRLVEQDHARLRPSARARVPAACAGRPTASRIGRRASDRAAAASSSSAAWRRTLCSRRATRRGAIQRMAEAVRRAGRAPASSMLSSTLMRVSTRGVWKVRTRPARAMASPRSARCGVRRKRMRPAAGARKPETRLNTVVLPAPLGPISAVIVPSATAKTDASTAATPPKERRRSCDLEQHHFSSSSSRRLPRIPSGRNAMNSTSSNPTRNSRRKARAPELISDSGKKLGSACRNRAG